MRLVKHRLSGQLCLASAKLNEICFLSAELLRICIICRISYLFTCPWGLSCGSINLCIHYECCVGDQLVRACQNQLVNFQEFFQLGRCHIGTLKLAHSRDIYTTEIAKCYKSRLLTLREPVVKD